jgi:hypothetical protein
LSLRMRPPANLRIKPLLRKECSLDRNCNRQVSKIAERVLVLCSRYPQPPPQLMQNLLLTPVYSLAADSPFPGQIAPGHGHMESDRVSGFFSEAPGEGEIQDRTRPLSQPGDPVVSSMPLLKKCRQTANQDTETVQDQKNSRRLHRREGRAWRHRAVQFTQASFIAHPCCADPRIGSLKR